MHYLVISTPRAEKPSVVRDTQKAWWDWINALIASGQAKHVYTKLGRGAVVIFDVAAPACDASAGKFSFEIVIFKASRIVSCQTPRSRL